MNSCYSISQKMGGGFIFFFFFFISFLFGVEPILIFYQLLKGSSNETKGCYVVA